MKPSNQLKLATFSLTVLALSGCQSGAFRKPDLGRLAFWKQDELSLASKRDELPPPSHHFSPDNGFADQGSATKSQSHGAELKSSIDDIIAEAKRTQQAKADAAANAAKSANAAAEALTDPIRQPYTLDKIDPKLSLKNSESTQKALNELQQFGSGSKNEFASATKSIADKANAALKNTTGSVDDLKNSFQASAGSGLKNAAEKLTSKAGSAANDAGSTLKNIAQHTQSSFGNTIENARSKIDNSFQPAGSKVVSNPFAASNNKSESSVISASLDPGGNDFASRFNQALAETETAISKSTARAGQTANQFISKTTTSTPDFSNESGVRQSSFDGAVSKTSAAILEPLTSQTTTTTTTQPFRSTATQPLRSTPPQSQSSVSHSNSMFDKPPTRTASAANQYPTTSSGTTQYPSTSYGVIKPMNTSTESTSSGSSFQVPTHLLRGEGSFSPGSTRPLRPILER